MWRATAADGSARAGGVQWWVLSPIVIAHRTCPLDAAENSLEGIARARLLGADAVEIDVRLTRDGQPVLMHDRTMRRTTGAIGPTRWRTSGAVRQLRLANGEQVPTFAEALSALPLALRLAIDVKSPRAVDAILAEISSQGAERRVLMWSQHASVVRATVGRCPGIECSLLRDTRTSWGDRAFLRAASRCGAHGISAGWDRVTPRFAQQTRAQGLRLYSWCRSPNVALDRLVLLDGIVSDFPAEARAAVEAIDGD